MICVHTSVEKCPGLSYDQINPILLPPKDPYSNLIGKVCHVQAGHMGTHYTASKIRNKWWITKITSLISKVIKGCQVCLVERGSRYHVTLLHYLNSDLILKILTGIQLSI